MEAAALRKPVLGSRVGGIPDLVKDGQNGFLFEKGDSNELAKKLKALLSDKNLAVEMGQRGRTLIQKNFSNQKYIDNYLKMIYF
jgi:glycosyltransferase involved in cell wall biosynthesis